MVKFPTCWNSAKPSQHDTTGENRLADLKESRRSPVPCGCHQVFGKVIHERGIYGGRALRTRCGARGRFIVAIEAHQEGMRVRGAGNRVNVLVASDNDCSVSLQSRSNSAEVVPCWRCWT